jgi:hypothetical protein
MTSDGYDININDSSWKQLNLPLLLLPNVFILAPVIVFWSHKFLQLIINKLLCLIYGHH